MIALIALVKTAGDQMEPEHRQEIIPVVQQRPQQGEPQSLIRTVLADGVIMLRSLDPNMLALVILSLGTTAMITWSGHINRELQHKEILGVIAACYPERNTNPNRANRLGELNNEPWVLSDPLPGPRLDGTPVPPRTEQLRSSETIPPERGHAGIWPRPQGSVPE
jgi:hypothetical protein